MREIQFASLLRTKELEIQLQMAKMEELKKAQATELSKSHQLTRQVSTFSQTENELRSQLNIYVEKFKQVSIPSLPNSPFSRLSQLAFPARQGPRPPTTQPSTTIPASGPPHHLTSSFSCAPQYSLSVS